MINSIHLRGFKCFTDNVFDLKPLTLLSGRNASGKTSLLQALALLHQTACECDNFEQLILNGPVIKLGRADDVLHKTKARNSVYFAVKINNEKWEKNYTADDRNALKFRRGNPVAGQDKSILPLFRRLTYLSADRQGPSEVHSLDESVLYPDVGAGGERAISRLIANDDQNVPRELCIKGTPPLLHKQIEAHMQSIFPGFRLDVQMIPGTNNATLSFAVNEGVGFVRPQNIGFGLSYTLPIYIACLSAKKGDVILIENPEAHLHPGAQSQVGAFLSLIAASGIQLIIESHSDHILNGIRRSVKSEGHPIQADNTIIFFFAGLSDDAVPIIFSPSISKNGSLSEWPNDFFDQYERDINFLVDWDE
jgi:predicted ATPase